MSLFSRLFRGPVNFVENKVEEAKGEVRKEIANGMASVTMIIIMAVTGLIVVFFISAGVALLLNYLIGSRYAGFLIVGAFYCILLGILIYLRNNEPFMERLRERYRKEFGVASPDIEEQFEIMEEEYMDDDPV